MFLHIMIIFVPVFQFNPMQKVSVYFVLVFCSLNMLKEVVQLIQQVIVNLFDSGLNAKYLNVTSEIISSQIFIKKLR